MNSWKKGMIFSLLVSSAFAGQTQEPAANILVIDSFENGTWGSMGKATASAKIGKTAMICDRSGKPWVVTKSLAMTDWSRYTFLSFWLNNENKDVPGKKLFVKVNSPQPGEDPVKTANYYKAIVPLDFQGWKQIRIPLDKFFKIRKPAGWNAVKQLEFSIDCFEPSTGSTPSVILDEISLGTETPESNQ
jgi:hypothetical protein